MDIIVDVLDDTNRKKITDLKNSHIEDLIERYIKLTKPKKVTVITDDEKDIAYVRELSLINGEEKKLKMDGHSIHFDGVNDQARDKGNTKILLPDGINMSPLINHREREEGLSEVLKIMDGIMDGKEVLIRFFCLGPRDSKFSILALQLTDSSYVAHSEDILYRQGYEEFKTLILHDRTIFLSL